MDENNSDIGGNGIDAPGGVWDVVVVGGGAAGLSGALTLARVRRPVLVIDAGEPRNAPAAAAHGLLGRDGIAPLELLRKGRDEVAAYGGRVVAGRVTAIHREDGRFVVECADGRRTAARRVLVASGLVDELPDVPGLAERWGRDVVHCVFCHGWEVRDTAVGVLGSFHQALLFRQLSEDVTLFLHPGTDLTDDQWEQLAGLGVGVVEGAVSGLATDDAGRLAGVRLTSGRTVPVRVLAVAPRFTARASFLGGLGLAVREHPAGFGEQLTVDASGFTGVDGVWAAGNVGDLTAGVPAAAAAGTTAAAAIVMDLLADDARAAARSRRAGDPEVFGAGMEAEVTRRVLGTRAHGVDPLPGR
ncbi:NAD(P)/FAD-dependent oxidoreductase [Actinacidiphila glaucinigra]|uniref:NAD(P)/FAD-dependent oxidoreductase n=1 Tax=Actinacidiphila glaucinigra TaxID=235986 RepID=UPI0036EBCF33